VTLVGRDGSIAAVRGDGAEVAVPVGEYRLGMLAIALNGADGDRGWNYVFSGDIASGDEALPSQRRWHDVQQGKLLALNPLGELTLTATWRPILRALAEAASARPRVECHPTDPPSVSCSCCSSIPGLWPASFMAESLCAFRPA
jgi:hypothetical protein